MSSIPITASTNIINTYQTVNNLHPISLKEDDNVKKKFLTEQSHHTVLM